MRRILYGVAMRLDGFLAGPQGEYDWIPNEPEIDWVPHEVLEDLGIQPQRTDLFETADGRVLEREVGFALLFAANRSAPTIVVFARPGDMVLLGAHGLEGMNLRVDLARKELVPAGPVPAAMSVGSFGGWDQLA